MTKPSSSNEQQRLEMIVSYLDGELSPAQSALIEKQLAEDPAFRQELQSMDRAWEALDQLPEQQANDTFSRTTMEMVVNVAQRELAQQTQALPRRHRQQRWGNVLLTLTACVLGLLIVRLASKKPNQALLADLPAIQYIDIYAHIQGVDFLRKLRASLGTTPWAIDPEDELPTTDEFFLLNSPDQRESWIAGLPADQRAALRARYHQFLSVSESERNRMNSLNAQIVAAEDRQQLAETMLAYRQWLLGLPASQQFELRRLSEGEQIRRIAEIQQREAAKPGIELSPEELRRLRNQLLDMRAQVLQSLPPQQRERLNGMGSNMGRMMLLVRHFPQFQDELKHALQEALSAEHWQQFQTLSFVEQREQLIHWINALRGQAFRNPQPGVARLEQISQEELERFFSEELSASEQERLLAQPRDQMEQQLRRLYLRGGVPPAGFPLDNQVLEGSWPQREGQDFDMRPPRRGFRVPPNDRRGFGPPPGRGPARRPDNRNDAGPPDGPPPPPPQEPPR